MSEQEKKDKRFGMIISGIIHTSLILIFFFLVAWREPDPPIPEYGIELNLGFQDEGGGDTEREAEALVEDTETDEQPDAPEETEQVEDVQEEVVEETTPPDPEPEPVTEEVVEVVEVEEAAEEVVEDPVTIEESEVAVEEKAEEVVEKKEEEKPPVEEKKEEEKPVEKPKPKPTLDNRAIMGGKKTNTENTNTSSNNQGDDRAQMGNKGARDGQTDTDGTTEDGGMSYSLEGWSLVKRTAEKDNSDARGTIVFDIKVNEFGRVESVNVAQRTTIKDFTVIDFYKKQVMSFVFRQKDSNRVFEGYSNGTVTFIIENN